ncbi:winged helix-turn-helix transcriptional regulator [Candidatus Woesearchaeota archaeon]|nr:winged helix-turn-helix transcriptional regulator [Candidatus Woesearchaeota archaeon]
MKNKIIILTILIILFGFQIVSALEIQAYKITATPETSATATAVDNIIELTIKNDNTIPVATGSLTFALDAEIEAIRDSYGSIEYAETDLEDSKKISFTFTIPINPGESRILTVQTKTHNIVEKEGYFEYLLVVVPPKEIPSFIHILKLNKDVVLKSTTAGTIIVPDATITETDEYTIIEWDASLEKDKPTVFLVRFSEDIGINYWKWFGIIVILIAIGVLGGVTGSRVYHHRKQKKALKATNILNEREKAVLNIIIKNPDIRQYEVVKQLGYTKSNMSKIMKRLEFRGLIQVKKEGKVRILNVGETLKKQL